MKKQITIVYEGEVNDGFTGLYLGEDNIEDITKYLESLEGTGKHVRITIECI